MASTDVVIIGAGPYGLGLAAHLAKRNIDHRVFGRPMDAWRRMSPGMYLKSFAFATSIPVPADGFDLPTYCRARSLDPDAPIEISRFAEYGLWVQQSSQLYAKNPSKMWLPQSSIDKH